MGLVAEFDIGCERLPLVSVSAAVTEATLVLELRDWLHDRFRRTRYPCHRQSAVPALSESTRDGLLTHQAG